MSLSFALNEPEWAYIHIELKSDTGDDFDLLTFKLAIDQAMRRFLGITGQTVAVEILKTDKNEAWLRTYADKLPLVISALGGSVNDARSLRIIRSSQSITGITGPLRYKW